jgi:hypothetical protein
MSAIQQSHRGRRERARVVSRITLAEVVANSKQKISRLWVAKNWGLTRQEWEREVWKGVDERGARSFARGGSQAVGREAALAEPVAPATEYLFGAPVGELHFYGDSAAEVIDDGFEGDRERAGARVEVLFPVAAAEGYGAEGDAVLLESEGEMVARGADSAGRLGEADIGRAEHGAFVAVAEGGEAFDLADGLKGESGERRLGVDEKFGDAFFLRDDPLGVRAEIAAERFDGGFIDGEAGGGLVTSVGDEVMAAGG